jgi:hypothetical protein
MDNVGMYGHRVGGKRWHLIESDIGFDLVMRCGRRMTTSERIAHVMEIAAEPGVEGLCHYCRRLRAVQ